MVSVDLQVSSAASFILSSLIAQRLSNLGRRSTDSCTTYTSCTINISPLIRGKVSAGTCQGTGGRGKRFLITHLLLGTYATSSRPPAEEESRQQTPESKENSLMPINQRKRG